MTVQRPQPKRHHYVPEMLQKRFTDERGHLHFFNKTVPDGGVLPAPPGKLLVEKHLYSRILDDGTKDAALEEQYSRLEGYADQLITKMLVSVERGICPLLTDNETRLWAIFVYEQWRRVPDLHERLMPKADAAARVSEAIASYEATHGTMPEQTKSTFLSAKYVEKFRQNAQVGALSRRSDTVLNALMIKGLFFAVCSKNTGFALGSAPVLKLTPQTNDLTHPSVEVWLPVAKRVAAVLGGYPFDGQIVPISKAQVIGINLEVAKRSTIFASHSPRLTREIARRLR